jgi:hypothetical protein
MLVLAYLSLPPCTPDELIRLRNPATLLNLIEQQVANRFVYPQNDLFIRKGVLTTYTIMTTPNVRTGFAAAVWVSIAFIPVA